MKSALAVWLVFAVAYKVTVPLGRLATREYRISTLRHVRGVLIPVRRHAEIEREVQVLQDVAGPDGEIFLVVNTAGFYYLVSGLQNPVPLDFPSVNALGPDGQDDLIAAIRRAQIRIVCVPTKPGASTPLRLEQYVVAEHATRTGRRFLPSLSRSVNTRSAAPSGFFSRIVDLTQQRAGHSMAGIESGPRRQRDTVQPDVVVSSVELRAWP